MKFRITLLCATGGRHFLQKFESEKLPVHHSAGELADHASAYVVFFDGTAPVTVLAESIRSMEIRPIEEKAGG